MYQAFRRWGIGTAGAVPGPYAGSVSGVPTVGYRNGGIFEVQLVVECIRRSDGGVSELPGVAGQAFEGVYQAFRRWGIGTGRECGLALPMSVSGVPTVGYRNHNPWSLAMGDECIRRSDGGVSEHFPGQGRGASGVYQAFRRWGIGTKRRWTLICARSVSGVPTVGYRNTSGATAISSGECIRRSDGGVLE